MLSSRTLTERTGVSVALKAENLQRTGSFKLRGALAKMAALTDAECERGVVAGQRGQPRPGRGLRGAGPRRALRGVHARGGADRQGRGAAALGAEVHLVGTTVEESLVAAHERAGRAGWPSCIPFDDPDVVAGQGGVGLELLAQVPDLARVVVPVGGGGLISGIAIAVKSVRPEVRGDRRSGRDLRALSRLAGAGEPVAVDSALTIADGIAVKRPGALTLALIRALGGPDRGGRRGRGG